jgi:hypothetical protein
MEYNTKNRVNWSNIFILPELIAYMDNLKELSLSSKLVRLKIGPIIFKTVTFNGYNYKKYFHNGKNILWRYFEYVTDEYNDSEDSSNTDTSELFDYTELRYSQIEPCCEELEEQLGGGIKISARELLFYYTENAGYYIFPLLNGFINLTKLEIIRCTVSFTTLCDLVNTMQNLESLIFKYATFSILEGYEITLNSINFPSTINELVFDSCKVRTNILFNNAYEFLFDEDNSSILAFKLSPTHISSLKTFTFGTGLGMDNGLKLFLEINPQLEHLKLYTSLLNQFIIDLIQFNRLLRRLILVCDHKPSTIIKENNNESINEIILYDINEALIPTLHSLCISSHNLNQLIIVITATRLNSTVNYSIDKFIEQIIPRCVNLRVLEIAIKILYNYVIDLNNLTNIEKLVIESNYPTLKQVKFSNCTSLKEFVFNYYDVGNKYRGRILGIRDVKSELLNLNNWKFEFNGYNILGARI